MKSVLIALLLVAIVLLVGSEARRLGGKGKPWLKSEFMSVNLAYLLLIPALAIH